VGYIPGGIPARGRGWLRRTRTRPATHPHPHAVTRATRVPTSNAVATLNSMTAENNTDTAPRTVGRPFPKGVSGNPGGRPKGLVRRIREETGDGEELVDYMLRVFRAEGESTKTRVEAASWLADRGFGRPQQTTLVGAADEQAKPSPYANMTAEELRAKLRAFLPDEPAA
jgi:hypothetical protein